MLVCKHCDLDLSKFYRHHRNLCCTSNSSLDLTSVSYLLTNLPDLQKHVIFAWNSRAFSVLSPDFPARIAKSQNFTYAISLFLRFNKYLFIFDSIVVSIPACHAGDRGSIPRRRAFIDFDFFGVRLGGVDFGQVLYQKKMLFLYPSCWPANIIYSLSLEFNWVISILFCSWQCCTTGLVFFCFSTEV